MAESVNKHLKQIQEYACLAHKHADRVANLMKAGRILNQHPFNLDDFWKVGDYLDASLFHGHKPTKIPSPGSLRLMK